MPGSWREAQAPVAELLAGAFEMLPFTRKRLLWLTGADDEPLRRRFGDHPNIILNKEDWQIDRLMVASNLVITKGTRGTLRELAALGIPSLSISHGLNWPDDVVASHISSNTFLDAREMDCDALSKCIPQRLVEGEPEPSDWPKGIQAAASRIAYHIDMLPKQVTQGQPFALPNS